MAWQALHRPTGRGSGTRARIHAVLVAEDDDALRETIAEVLRDAGYHVLVAAHGAQALETMRREKLRLVILDAHMPFVDGLEVRRAQLADPALANIGVLGLTADVRVTFDDAVPVLSKPFELDDLLRIVEALCAEPVDTKGTKAAR